MLESCFLALIGGALIGLAAALLLASNGRIAGISGVIARLVLPEERDAGWRISFLVGLCVPGVIAAALAPHAVGASAHALPVVALGGVLVGVGTRLGNGCTSGHGVCGLSRLSKRSLVAVLVFMATGAITASLAGGS